MQFIIPNNYNFKNKLFGFISYSTAILIITWCFFCFCLVNLIFNNINLKIVFFSFFTVPFFVFAIINNKNENILIVFIYIFKFIFKPKLYLYNKELS